MATVSAKPWSMFSAADYTDSQYCNASLIHDHKPGEPGSKATCKLPIKEPSGTLNKNGVHAAASVLAGGRGGVKAPASDKAKAARALLRAYGTIGDEPPDSLKRVAGQ